MAETATLLDELEGWRWLLCEQELAAAGGELSHGALEVTWLLGGEALRDLDWELTRRRRIRRDHPAAPPWPDAGPARQAGRRADLARIKREADLVRLVERVGGVALVERGKRWVGRCPFPDHADRTPSFSVDAARNLVHCYGCGRGGDVFTFLLQFGVFERFVDAVRWLERSNAAARGAGEREGRGIG